MTLIEKLEASDYPEVQKLAREIRAVMAAPLDVYLYARRAAALYYAREMYRFAVGGGRTEEEARHAAALVASRERRAWRRMRQGKPGIPARTVEGWV